jgi:urea carboxylase-associated protein 2
MTTPKSTAPPEADARGTADPAGARQHARSQEHTRVEAMPTVPATSSSAPPSGVAAADLLWDETIAGGGYAARELHRGARLRLTDLHGDGCVAMLVFNAERPVERLNVADTVKVQWNAYLGAGRLLLSDMGRALMSILEDDAGTHDTFCGASNEAGNARKYGSGANWGPTPNARDRFLLGCAKFGLARRDIHPCVTWFKGVRIDGEGNTLVQIGPFAPGRAVTLRAEMNLLVVLANCPHPLDPRPAFCVSAVRACAWRGPVAPPEDPLRSASPEARRALWNVDEYFRR